jgi:hypothetical protein
MPLRLSRTGSSLRRALAAMLVVGALQACASAPPRSAASACEGAEAALAGAWGHASGGGSFEQFELAREGDARPFRSWLHERPDTNGDWSFDPSTCRLRIDAGGLRWDYHVALQGDALQLRDAQGGDRMHYRRIAD